MISQDRSQGQSSNLCFSCFFLASAHLRKSQAVCLVERCVAGPHRAESEINFVPSKAGCVRSPSSSCCTLWILSYCLKKIARADSTLFKCDTDMTHVFSVVFIFFFFFCIYWKQSMFCLRSGSHKSWLTEESWKWLQGRGEKGIPGRLQSRVVIWRCGAYRLHVPVCPAGWGLIYKATVRQTSEQYFALLYTVLLSAVLSNTSIVGLMETWVCLSTTLWLFFFFLMQRRKMSTVVLKTADFHLFHSQLIFRRDLDYVSPNIKIVLKIMRTCVVATYSFNLFFL